MLDPHRRLRLLNQPSQLSWYTVHIMTTASEPTPSAAKLYCYVDETGQDTLGDLFIVAVVIAERDRDQVVELCERIERESGKGRVKWIRTDYPRRLEYLRCILKQPAFRRKLHFSTYRNSKDYLANTVSAIARSLGAFSPGTYEATVLIDALPRSLERKVGHELRLRQIRVRKVRGLRKDENDALIRLADAVCGLVRASGEGQEPMVAMLNKGKKEGALVELP